MLTLTLTLAEASHFDGSTILRSSKNLSDGLGGDGLGGRFA